MPAPRRILETSLYVEDMTRASQFYREVVGLALLSSSERITALDAGEGTVLLLFKRGATLQGLKFPGGHIPPHDGSGPLHFAFAVDEGDLDGWEEHLGRHGVVVESRVRWGRGGRSLYFRDPDGHSVELATPGVWDNW